MISFVNDEFLKTENHISIRDRGFTLGDGVFDTMLVIDGEPQDQEAHFNRLEHDAAILDISLNKDFAKLVIKIIEKNKAYTGRYAIRTQVTRGVAPRGLKPPSNAEPSIVMTIAESPETSIKPVKTIIAQTVRRNEHSPLSRIKSLNYGDNILALLEAKDLGAEEVILLNTEGHVTCASASNIFIREKDEWITPPVSDGVLPGITRKKLLIEKNAREESINLDRLKSATEVFQCNSIIGLRPLSVII